MTITFLGNATIKIQTSNATVLLDPHSGVGGLRAPRAQADLVALTQAEGRNPDAGGSESFVVDGPGEYEVKGVALEGASLPGTEQTLFTLTIEDIRLGHVGDLNRAMANGELEHLEGVDVLFVPVGGHGVLDAKKAAELVTAIEPRIVIPIHFKVTGLKTTREPVAPFLKEMGAKDSAPQDKFRLVKKELPQDETQVIVLEAV